MTEGNANDFLRNTFLNKMCRVSKFEYFIFYTTYFRINKQQLVHPEISVTDVSEKHLGGKFHGNRICCGKGRSPGDSFRSQ